MSHPSRRSRVWTMGAIAGLASAIAGGCNALTGADALDAGDCVGDECADATADDGGGGGFDGFADRGRFDAPADARVDGNAGLDAAADAFTPDCGAKFYCPSSGNCVVACNGCTSGILECPALTACLATCTTCPASTIDCYQCQGLNAPSGRCKATATACVLGGPFNGCSCNVSHPSMTSCSADGRLATRGG